MKRAWEIFRSEKVTFSYALSKSWREVKSPDLFAAMKAMDKIMAENKAKKPSWNTEPSQSTPATYYPGAEAYYQSGRRYYGD